jgi:G3E family GTPase
MTSSERVDSAAGSATQGSSTPIPLSILTGFLGAGKTTLLNRILSGDHGLRIAVLVNDFGSVNIDAELVIGITDDMISLANGCVCCEIRDDLVEAVDRVLESPEQPDYVLLEASGVADPMGIYATFDDERHRDRLRLDSVTCVVDAEQVFTHIEGMTEILTLIVRQIGSADLVVLNKSDLVGQERMDWLHSWIDGLMNRVRIIDSAYCDIPWEVLLSTDASAQLALEESGDDEVDHAAQFDRWSFESADPLSIAAYREMIRRELPGDIYRMKGIVYASEDPDHRYIAHTVGRRSEIRKDSPWGDRPRRTRLVAIGARHQLDEQWLHDTLSGCIPS